MTSDEFAALFVLLRDIAREIDASGGKTLSERANALVSASRYQPDELRVLLGFMADALQASDDELNPIAGQA